MKQCFYEEIKLMADVKEVAKWFLAAVDRQSGEAITHLKLQKLIYYAQAWYLALENKALFPDKLEAWAHGPVCRSVYDTYRDYGWDALPAPDDDIDLLQCEIDHLEMIMDAYGDMSAKKLEHLTHGEEPWIEARGDLPAEARCNTKISQDTMTRFYQKVYQAAQADG
ncbi:hypothetical protein ASY01nite_13870 [Acetobacter syzygii]|nr:phage associated protein [Acetobacter syzygii]GBR64899.1 phage-associated protein [Acetobacter syzygii NRIC 0483]GEL56321.1 hypothetical protein ASY01nite_13870 [Acetobacter syzygii]